MKQDNFVMNYKCQEIYDRLESIPNIYVDSKIEDINSSENKRYK